jgi:hypothetical protein
VAEERFWVTAYGFASAVLSSSLRGERQPWGAEDTAFVFGERFKAAPLAQKAYDSIWRG